MTLRPATDLLSPEEVGSAPWVMLREVRLSQAMMNVRAIVISCWNIACGPEGAPKRACVAERLRKDVIIVKKLKIDDES